MKEILLINLTRMGDLLQTTPLMAGLKEMHPDSRITLLVNSAFSEICRGIPNIDDLIEFDMKGYRARLADAQHSLVANYRILEDLVLAVNQKQYDLAINITHSSISAVLTSLVRTREIRGFTIDTEGHRVIKHPWMRYFFNVIPNRTYNPFHIVDMYLKMGDVMPETKGLLYHVSAEDEERADTTLKGDGIAAGDTLVGLHLGASKSEKTWPVSSYAELARLMSSNFGAKIVLFGTAAEAELAEEFELTSDVDSVNFVGRTNIGELAALLKKCRLFISNDTGPLHIATSVGTMIIDISMANVHFLETGPYGEGHYVVQADLPCAPCGFDVECNNRVCKTTVTPGAVLEVAREALHEKGAVYSADLELWSNVQVYKSHFTREGFLGFTPLIKHPLSKECFYRIIYRHVWNMSPESSKGESETVFEDICREISHYGPLACAHETVPSLSRELDSIKRLVTISEKGFHLLIDINKEAAKEKMDVRKVKEIWGQINSIETEIDLIGHTNPCFRPLSLIFNYSKEALEGNDLRGLTEESGRIYEDFKFRVRNMMQLMEWTVPVLERDLERKSAELTSGLIH